MAIKEDLVSYLRREGAYRTPEAAQEELHIPRETLSETVMELIQQGDTTFTYGCGVFGLREWKDRF